MIAADYKEQLLQLLPPGLALSRDPDSKLVLLLAGMAEELSRIDARGDAILEEADPTTATELFAEWLTMAGIPDACTALADDPGDERLQLLQKLSAQAGQTPEFYIDLAHSLGYVSSVKEFAAFVAGSSAGEPLYNEEWVYSFALILADVAVTAQAGIARAGDRVATFEADLVNCILQRVKPAHTVAFVGFE